jgi:hypothetical protein
MENEQTCPTTEPEVAITGPCIIDNQKTLKEMGIKAYPGQVFEICKHKRLECDECDLVLPMEEADNRTPRQRQLDSEAKERRRIDQ